jgi:hypothetical protein
MKYKGRKANSCKVQHKRRSAALFEQHENTHAKPDDTYDREKNYRRCPTRNRVYMPEVRVKEVVREAVGGLLIKVCQAAVDTDRFEVHLDIRRGCNFLGLLAFKAYTDQTVADRDPGTRTRKTGRHFIGKNSLGCLSPPNAVRWRKVLKCPLRQVERGRRR